MSEGTVVDRLLMTLGLDDKDFKRGQEETTKRTKEMRNVTKSSSEDMAKSLALVAKQFTLGALGVGSMVEAIRTFSRITVANDQLGLMAKNLGVGVSDLNAWGNAAETAGAKASDIQSAFATINKEAFNLRAFGPDQFTNYLRLLGVNPLTPTGQSKDPQQTLLEIADGLHKIEQEKGRVFAENFAESMGFTQGAFNLFHNGSAELQKLLEAQKAIGVATDQDSEAARRLDAALSDLGHTYQNLGRKIVTSESDNITELLKFFAHPFRGDFFGGDVYDVLHGGGYDPNKGGTAFGHINRGGTVSDRNNNPGNLKPVGFSYPGQTGVDANGFAIFPTPEAGRAALQGDLRAKFNRGDNTISSLITDYEGHDFKRNNIAAYIASVSQQTGIGANQTFSADRLEQISRAITRQEGTSGFGGTNNTHSVDIGSIVINTQATDSAGIAADMNNQLKRKMTLAQADGSSS